MSYILPAVLTFDIIMPVNSAELHHMSFVSTCLRFPGQPLVGTVKPLFIYWVAFYFSFYFGQILQRTSEHAERRAAIPSEARPHINVISVTKTVTPALVYSAASDVATVQQEINTIKKTHQDASPMAISDRRRPRVYLFTYQFLFSRFILHFRR